MVAEDKPAKNCWNRFHKPILYLLKRFRKKAGGEQLFSPGMPSLRNKLIKLSNTAI
jgi:hypothetical protein